MPEERSLRQVYRAVAALRALLPGADTSEILRAAIIRMRTARDLETDAAQGITSILSCFEADALLSDILAHDDDALGLIHQALNAPGLEAAYRATTRHGRKFEPAEIPLVSQLFTPMWVVDFLVQNTLGRTWMEMHPDSRVQLPWLIVSAPGGDQPGPAPVRCAGELRILDPACGTMNFGLAAIDLLRQMYREERDRAGTRGWPAEPSATTDSDIDSSIVSRNLFGIDIDPTALALAAESLAVKLGRASADLRARANLCRQDALFARMPRGWPTAFDAVLTNPPYLAARNLPRRTVERMKRSYPCAWRDQGACFLARCASLARQGRVGVLTMQSFLFTGGFAPLRDQLCSAFAVEGIAHFGPGVFDVGNPGTLQTAAVVMRAEPDPQRRAAQNVVGVRLVDVDDKRATLRATVGQAAVPGTHGSEGVRYDLSQEQLTAGPRGAWCYWLNPLERSCFVRLPKLGTIAPPRQGLATTDNARFVRYWWEVTPTSPDAPCRASTATWVPYVKSGRFRRWYEAPMHRVNWRDDGAEIKAEIVRRYPYLHGEWQWVAKNAQCYFRPGITYSYLTSGAFSARQLDAGAIFDVAGSSLFPEDPLPILAILNSSTAGRLLHAINPTVNFQVGDLRELPIPVTRDFDARLVELRQIVGQLIELTRELDTFDELSPDFIEPMEPTTAARIASESIGQRSRLEERLNSVVADLYGLEHPTATTCAADAGVLGPAELARAWVSFALRGAISEGGDPLRLSPLDARVARRVRDRIGARLGGDGVGWVSSALGADGIDGFLSRDLARWHSKRYRGRPIWWVLGRAESRWLVRHDHATAEVLGSIARVSGISIPPRWDRIVDRGIGADLESLFAGDRTGPAGARPDSGGRGPAGTASQTFSVCPGTSTRIRNSPRKPATRSGSGAR